MAWKAQACDMNGMTPREGAILFVRCTDRTGFNVRVAVYAQNLTALTPEKLHSAARRKFIRLHGLHPCCKVTTKLESVE